MLSQSESANAEIIVMPTSTSRGLFGSTLFPSIWEIISDTDISPVWHAANQLIAIKIISRRGWCSSSITGAAFILAYSGELSILATGDASCINIATVPAPCNAIHTRAGALHAMDPLHSYLSWSSHWLACSVEKCIQGVNTMLKTRVGETREKGSISYVPDANSSTTKMGRR